MKRALSKLVTLTLTKTRIGSAFGKLRYAPETYRRLTWSRGGYVNHFYGVFPTYAAAQSALPPRIESGWEHDELVAADYFQPSLYATLYWLVHIVRESTRIVDFGGATGQTHREYVKRMALPQSVSWTVVDLPPAIRRGRELADANRITGLFFAERLEDVRGCDIFLSRGCLQYVETPLCDLISSLPALPEYLLLDKIPLSDGPSVATIQNLQVSAAPYQIFNREAFLAPLLQRGYSIVDEWPVQELSCAIPFHPERYLATHTGLILRRTRPESAASR